MMPRLGNTYGIDIDVAERLKEEYTTDEYFELDLPVAPAVMVGDEIIVEGTDVTENDLEAAICRHLGLAGPPKKKSIFDRIAGK